MSTDLYVKHPELKNDEFMKKIDDAMSSGDPLAAIDAAISGIDKASQNDIKKAHAYTHKGVIHYKRGEVDKAKEMWNTANKITKDSDAEANLQRIGIPK